MHRGPVTGPASMQTRQYRRLLLPLKPHAHTQSRQHDITETPYSHTPRYPVATDQSMTRRSCIVAEVCSSVAWGTKIASAVPFSVRRDEEKERSCAHPLTSMIL